MTEQRLTRMALGIFWEGEEVAGITVYGFWPSQHVPAHSFPSTVWPPGTLVHTSKLSGPGWTVWLWDIRVSQWPPSTAWQETIRQTQQAMIAAGARVAWCGLEGFFADPPDL